MKTLFDLISHTGFLSNELSNEELSCIACDALNKTKSMMGIVNIIGQVLVNNEDEETGLSKEYLGKIGSALTDASELAEELAHIAQSCSIKARRFTCNTEGKTSNKDITRV